LEPVKIVPKAGEIQPEGKEGKPEQKFDVAYGTIFIV
jgi:hypothetical protein